MMRGVDVLPFGGFGDYAHGELGGVQILLEQFMLDFGQRPDHWNQYYGFPRRPKRPQELDISDKLGMYTPIKDAFRHDLNSMRGYRPGPVPFEVLLTHPHYDHAGGISLLRHDMPLHMSAAALKVLYCWQYTSGPTMNQFVDMFDQFSTARGTDGKLKFLKGEESVIPRNIKTFEAYKTFSLGDWDVTPYPLDHSVPGSNAFICKNRSLGMKIAISGDMRVRGQHPEYTQKFLIDAKDTDYFFCEGSLLHFDHEGNEADVSDKLQELMHEKSFAGISCPPRDLDRLLSVYQACKKEKRMFCVSPQMAAMLLMFDGEEGYPKLDWKYIGVLMMPKKKGLIDKEGWPDRLIEGDYYTWERFFVRLDRWKPKMGLDEEEDKKLGHLNKLQRVSIYDVAKYQDQFLVYMTLNNAVDVLEAVKPAENSIYIRSHPAPWTLDMEVQEEQLINILKAYGVYDGEHLDHLTPVGRTKTEWDQDFYSLPVKPNMKRLHTVHVTGHMNRRELKSALRGYEGTIVVYHNMFPQDFEQDLANDKKLIIPYSNRPFRLTV